MIESVWSITTIVLTVAQCEVDQGSDLRKGGLQVKIGKLAKLLAVGEIVICSFAQPPSHVNRH